MQTSPHLITMPRHIDREIEEIRDSPATGDSVTILLGVENEKEPIIDSITEIGGEIRADLPYGGLRVEIPQDALDDVCALAGLRSVEATHQLTPQ